MPGALTSALEAAQPRLWAREQLDRIHAATVGSGSADKHESRSYIRDLRRIANSEPVRSVAKMPAEMRRHVLESMGIRVRGDG